MTEKKKIDLKKQDFKWGSGDGDKSTEQEISLSTMVESVNQQPSDNLSPIAKDRKEQRGTIDSAVEMIPTSMKGLDGEKGTVGKSRDEARENYVSAVESIGSEKVGDNSSKTTPVESSVTEAGSEVSSKGSREEGESYISTKPKKSSKSKVSESSSEVEKFKGNVKEMWKSVLGVVILLVAIIVGISYKDPKPSTTPVTQPEPVKQSELKIDKDIPVVTSDNKTPVLGEVVTSDNNIVIPVLGFNQDGSKKAEKEVGSGNLSLASVLPLGNGKVFNTISLAQWPNAVNLQDVPTNLESITALFPEHLYKKADNFQESLIIYDKRSAEQEKFVRQSQSCYFFPGENNGTWMGVNFYVVSYCFLNSQFIGFNIYTNNGPDVMKKVENNVSKYPYLHISSVQKLNGFNVINIEQNQAYKILEEYRVQLLNNMISKK